jgi:hypothetical protein
MKKLLAVLIAFLLVMPVFATAQDLVAEPVAVTVDAVVAPASTTTNSGSGKALKIETLAVLGNGIAVSPSDAMDFKMVKVGIGTVDVELLGETTSITVGIMFLDEVRYKLKEIVIAEGEASGNVYTYSSDGTESMVGSFKLQSVMKGDQEIWAGTLTVSGATFHLYVIAATRKVNTNEYKERVADYCIKNPNDENCRDKIADYCENNPNDNRCQKLFMAHCVQGKNLEDARCRDFVNRYCEANPEKGECRTLAYRWSNKYCEDNSDAALCVKINAETVEYCLKEPNQERCREFCQENPEKCKDVVTNLAEFCVNNENHDSCRAYCQENPAACKKVAESVIKICISEPNRDECKDYCQEHPVACGRVREELAKFCIGNADNERCVDFCTSYPNACRKVANAVDDFCENNPDNSVCGEWCRKYPARCETDDDDSVVTDVSGLIADVTGVIPTGNTDAANTGG